MQLTGAYFTNSGMEWIWRYRTACLKIEQSPVFSILLSTAIATFYCTLSSVLLVKEHMCPNMIDILGNHLSITQTSCLRCNFVCRSCGWINTAPSWTELQRKTKCIHHTSSTCQLLQFIFLRLCLYTWGIATFCLMPDTPPMIPQLLFQQEL